MREFYRNCRKRKFDLDFIHYINQFDFLVLGGGGFFDLRWDYSATGTTIDILDEYIDLIQIPVLVNAMGYHEHPVSEATADRFCKFIEKISNKENWLVTLRNDGSYQKMITHFPELSKCNIRVVPDNAFMAKKERLTIEKYEKVVGMSLSDDLLCEQFNGSVTSDIFINQIGVVINYFLEKDYHIVFLFIHHRIYQWLISYYEICQI